MSTTINERDEMIRRYYIHSTSLHSTQLPIKCLHFFFILCWPTSDLLVSQLSDHQLSDVRAQRVTNMADCEQCVPWRPSKCHPLAGWTRHHSLTSFIRSALSLLY